MLHLMTLYTTQRKQYVCWSDQSPHTAGSVLNLRIINFVQEFRFLEHVMAADRAVCASE